MKVLWLGDAGCTTGFGRVSHAIGDRLVQDYGHDIHALATNYEGDYWPTKLKLYRPTTKIGMDVYGQSRFVEMLGEVMPDVVVMLNDPYVVLKFLFRNRYDPDFVLARMRPILAYMPVDGTNFPASWTRLPELVNGSQPMPGGTGPKFVPVVMAKHGRALFPNAPLVYHGIDTKLFHPVSAQDPIVMTGGRVIESKADAKRVLGMKPDDFLVVRVDRNSHRKNFGDTWRALVPLMKRFTNIHVWFHCKVEGDSLEIPQVIAREPSIAERFHYPGNFSTKTGWGEPELATVYNAADVFVSTSWGEGFGLTLGEALASGVPVVAQNVSSIPEVVGPGGLLLEPERLCAVDSGQDQWLPNVPAFTDAIERLYNSRKLRRELGEAGRAHVVNSFSWDLAAKQFDELITRTAQEAPAPFIGEEIDAEPVGRPG